MSKSDLRLLAPTAVAAGLAAVYVIVSPPSLDLAAHLFRAKLFEAEGFGIWDNWWYGGHHTPGYSVLFPAVSAALTPQLAAALAATASAAMFDSLVRRHFGSEAWVGALWFAAATATNLYTGRLAFAFGLLPAMATAVALERGRPGWACWLAALTGLCSPVAALFAALAGGAYALGPTLALARRGSPRRSRSVWVGLAVALAGLLPVGLLAVGFPEGGHEPFAFSSLWPILVIGAIAYHALPARERTIRIGIVLYLLGCVLAYLISTPVGSNASRLGPLLAGPLAAILWWRRRPLWLLAAALPLLYVQWQAPIRDLRTAVGDPAGSSAYWRPLLRFLERHSKTPPFRIEIPFTQFHWEAYEVAPRFPIARGWERQLDIKDDNLFYGSPLTPATYDDWLHQLAVRYVAVPDARLDYAGVAERKLIDSGLPFLRLVLRTRHWRVYEVAAPAPLASGAASAVAIGPDSVSLTATHPGSSLVRVRYTPYWALSGAPGCVAPDGDFTRVTFRRAGPVRLVISFSLGRIETRSPRCSG